MQTKQNEPIQQNETHTVGAAARDERIKGLIRIGEMEMTGEGQAEIDAYFAPDFTFHAPDGSEWKYQGLTEYFAALRTAFDDLTITRGIMLVENDHVACQTTITGNFVREFTHSPVGALPPTGKRVEFRLTNIFRYDSSGRLTSATNESFRIRHPAGTISHGPFRRVGRPPRVHMLAVKKHRPSCHLRARLADPGEPRAWRRVAL